MKNNIKSASRDVKHVDIGKRATRTHRLIPVRNPLNRNKTEAAMMVSTAKFAENAT